MIDFEPLFGSQRMLGKTVEFRIFPRVGAERWLLEKRFHRPWHLETWPRSNIRANAIYWIARIMGTIGLSLPSRSISINIVHGSVYDVLCNRFSSLGIFLGTPGPNRKFVAFAKEGEKTWFIKIPISPRSSALVRAESEALSILKGDVTFAGLVPEYFWIGNCLVLEDIAVNGTTYGCLHDEELVRVHERLYARSRITKFLAEVVVNMADETLDPVSQNDTEFVALISSARRAANIYLGTLDKELQVELYMGHGDFTRWNVLKAKNGAARIIDWELFGLYPKYFDIFHYKVSFAILVEQAKPVDILQRIAYFTKIHLENNSFTLYFGLYLANQTLNCCNIFERQSSPFSQAYWQMSTLTELLRLVHEMANISAGTDNISNSKLREVEKP